MAIYEAPDYSWLEKRGPKVFLAGGITGCPEWQKPLAGMLESHITEQGLQWAIMNPRREDWPEDPKEIRKQIEWEHKALVKSKVISFWFPKETMCPITLFELGRWSFVSGNRLVVGVHPEYARKLDVEIQMSLLHKPIEIVDNLDALYSETVKHLD